MRTGENERMNAGRYHPPPLRSKITSSDHRPELRAPRGADRRVAPGRRPRTSWPGGGSARQPAAAREVCRGPRPQRAGGRAEDSSAPGRPSPGGDAPHRDRGAAGPARSPRGRRTPTPPDPPPATGHARVPGPRRPWRARGPEPLRRRRRRLGGREAAAEEELGRGAGGRAALFPLRGAAAPASPWQPPGAGPGARPGPRSPGPPGWRPPPEPRSSPLQPRADEDPREAAATPNTPLSVSQGASSSLLGERGPDREPSRISTPGGAPSGFPHGTFQNPPTHLPSLELTRQNGNSLTRKERCELTKC
nr:proline-rich protein HaeIII subfamily 1-like [Desmodus rotundus]